MANDLSDLKNVTDMAMSYCACAIANFEGFKHVDLPTGDRSKVTLEDLDTRVRKLEILENIARPPPMQEPSWDAITWRISRLPRPWPEAPVPNRVPAYIKTSLPLLRSTVESMLVPNPMVWPDESKLDEKELLSLVLQWLCYVAGRRSFRVNSTPFEVEAVCLLALNLSLSSESRPGNHPGRTPFPIPGPIGFRPNVPAHGCCNRCLNPYQRARLRNDMRSILDEYNRDHRVRGGKWRVAGWFRKLAFWRRKRNHDDDASTISTVSSNTLMD